MMLEDRVATLEPTHILIKVNNEPVGAFSIVYPEDSIIDEIDCDWIKNSEGGWEPEEEQTWAIMFIMMGSESGHVFVRTSDLDLVMKPDCSEFDVESPDFIDGYEEVVTLSDITEAEYESLYAIADLPLLHVEILEGGIADVWYPRDELRTPEQIAAVKRNIALFNKTRDE